jgi:hypothetical protein
LFDVCLLCLRAALHFLSLLDEAGVGGQKLRFDARGIGLTAKGINFSHATRHPSAKHQTKASNESMLYARLHGAEWLHSGAAVIAHRSCASLL